MTNYQYLKKYDPNGFAKSEYGSYLNYFGDLTEPDHHLDNYSQGFSYCCGVIELECTTLKITVDEDKMSQQQFIDFLFACLNEEGYAGAVITDISTKDKVHKYLSSIIKPVKLGVNKSTSNTIYIWTISINDLKAKSKEYGKTVKAKKPTTRKKTKAY